MSDMDPRSRLNSGPSTLDRVEHYCSQFESAWQSGTPPQIEDFLGEVTPLPLRGRVLLEIVLIDLDFRWRVTGERPLLEDYLASFAELGPLEQADELLIVGEYKVRRRSGDHPTHDEYMRRFPEKADLLPVRLTEADRGFLQETAAFMDRASAPKVGGVSSVRMPRPPWVEQLVALGVIATEGLDALFSELPEDQQPRDAASLARRLAERGELTRFQAAAVAGGKAKSLVLGNYVILDRLGAGGMGQVYRAWDRGMERVVAVKVLLPGAIDSPEAVKRFQQEVKAAGRLAHPNIVTAYYTGQQRGRQYLAMEYVDGPNLGTVVKDHGPLPVNEAVECILQVARGLEYAHRQGVIHRDIKPSNLLLSREGTVKILDMGLARLAEPLGRRREGERLTSTGRVMGTCDYMAPEQAEDSHKADHRADIYSLGCTLYRLLAGRPPYPAESALQVLLAHREAPIPSLGAACQGIPPELDTVFQKMVAKRADDRYFSMSEVLDALGGTVDWACRLGNRLDGQVRDARLSALCRRVSAGVVAAEATPRSVSDDTESCPAQGDTGPARATQQRRVDVVVGKSPALLLDAPTNSAPLRALQSWLRGWLARLVRSSLAGIRGTEHRISRGRVLYAHRRKVAMGAVLAVVLGALALKVVTTEVATFPIQQQGYRILPAANSPLRGPGLVAELFSGTGFERSVKKRIDRKIDWLWGYESPDPELVPDNFSICWNGWLRPPRAGHYELVTISDDGVRLAVDGHYVIDAWYPHYAERSVVGVDLDDHPHAIHLEYFEGVRAALMSLRWIVPGSDVECVIPADCLFCDKESAEKAALKVLPSQPVTAPPTAQDSRGLVAEVLVADSDLQRKILTRIDYRIDWLWGTSPPDPSLGTITPFWVRWTGRLKAPRPGRYKLAVVHGGGVRIWLDERLAVDGWNSEPSSRSVAEVELTDVSHPLRIEYCSSQMTELCSLRWTPPGESEECVIPASALSHDPLLTNATVSTATEKSLDASCRTLIPEMARHVPLSWTGNGAFAEIKGGGKATFPRVAAASYVIETELLIRNPRGLMAFVSGDSENAFELAMGPIWEDDQVGTEVLCRLLRLHPFGCLRWDATPFPVGSVLPLKIVVSGAQRALFYRGRLLLTAYSCPTDLELTIKASDQADCTIRFLIVRELKPHDLADLGWPVPAATIVPDSEQIRVLEERLALDKNASPRQPTPGRPFFVPTSGTPLRWIKPGTFRMGAPEAKYLQFGQGEQQVQITLGFWIGQYEMTQGEWETIMKTNPSRIKGSPYLPAHWIGRLEAVSFCTRLNRLETTAGRVPSGYEYRLPTEAEWEYSCRADSRGHFALLPGKFWRPGPSGGGPQLVGSCPPNAWGLYDMQGNVPEWCLDVWEKYRSDDGATVDRFIRGEDSEDALFVVRGGGWWCPEDESASTICRDRSRANAGGDRGFRLVLGPILK